MGEERDQLYNEQEYFDLIRRYEEMVMKKIRYFFDVHEFENIIDYYIECNKYQEAITASAFSIEQHPTALSLQLKKAQILIERGQPVESLKLLNDVSRVENQNYEVFLLKGNAYCILGKIKEAIKQFDTALNLCLESTEEVLFEIALSFEHIQEYRAAIQYLKRAHEDYPENTSIIYDLAYCHERTDEWHASILYYKKYLDIEPFSEHVWFNLGNVLTRLGKYDDAINAYDFALSISPDYGSAFFNKANALINAEKYTEAIEVYKEYLATDEEAVEVYCYIGECYEKLLDTRNARYYHNKALEYDDGYAEAWFGLGMTAFIEKDLDKSIVFFEKATRLEDEAPEYWFMLASAQYKKGYTQSASDSYRKTVFLDPEDVEAWLNYSNMWFELHQLDKAIRILNESYELHWKNSTVNFRLAGYHLLNGQKDLAINFLEKAFKGNAPTAISEFLSCIPNSELPEEIILLIKKHNS